MEAKDLKKKADSSSAVAFHKFVLLQKDHNQDLFCFYEGNDNGYYYPRIKEFYNGVHHPIKCGNKKSVLYMYKSVKTRYPEVKCSFFIDNDFDERIENPKIYETPCYSIENFYTSKNFISDILKNEFGLSEIDSEYKTALDVFDTNQQKYHNESLLFNAWYASLKEKANTNKCSANVNLNCSIPKEFFILKIGSISSDYNFDNLKNKYPEAISISEKEVNNKIKEFQLKDLSKTLRGKYELEFIYTFLNFLIDDANDPENGTILKNKTKFRVDKAQMLSQLSQYAETPNCLVKYIEQLNKVLC
ncbi:DUF4435 domain-containing protein [Labilibaculum euxinus]|uniref:DUF4435 domain-containing protein n=1 Tax=Labilibaculum euxinus TaxID=2686357 RepID=A0A7M4DB44_9BACT|nr:DUF4435 domain-containing protein [Labilibaculum euxinus]MUP39873.1 DUF4435 domain-containing protein [Labilibaculum euxinus]MVB09078.1 DUF4435 domain-containing protein [Labilibaculum euxinus]